MVGLAARLERCRRLLVVAGADVFSDRPDGGVRAAQLLWEMERFYESFLVVAEAGLPDLRQAGVLAVLPDTAAADDPLLADFLAGGAILCLVLGARCTGSAAEAAVGGVWRARGHIAELGARPSALAVLADARHTGEALDLLEELWDSFLTGMPPRTG